MTAVADPHPGLDVAVEGRLRRGAVAHRRGTTLAKDVSYRDGRMMLKPVWPVIAACGKQVDLVSLSWGHAAARGATTCPTCFPAVE